MRVVDFPNASTEVNTQKLILANGLQKFTPKPQIPCTGEEKTQNANRESMFKELHVKCVGADLPSYMPTCAEKKKCACILFCLAMNQARMQHREALLMPSTTKAMQEQKEMQLLPCFKVQRHQQISQGTLKT